MKKGYINLKFNSFKPVKDSAITFDLDFSKNINKFAIKCDNKKVGSNKEIKKEWKLVPFLMTTFCSHEIKISLTFEPNMELYVHDAK